MYVSQPVLGMLSNPQPDRDRQYSTEQEEP